MDQIDIDAIQGTSSVEGAIGLLQESITINEKIEDALAFATDAHKEQFRKSGEPYIVHPILVASIVAKITEDESMVMAALLHDVVEDTPVTIEEVKARYGDDVAHLVGGLTKIDHAILTAGGILCIQTKHYSGIVFGGEEEPQWTNVDGTLRRRFLNPLIQNEGRTRALQNVLPDVPVANVVVFTGKVDFPTPPPKNVIRVGDIDSFIAKFVFGPSKVKDWDAAWLTVKSAALTDDATRRDLQAQIA